MVNCWSLGYLYSMFIDKSVSVGLINDRCGCTNQKIEHRRRMQKKTYTQEYTGIFRIKCNIKQTITGLLDCSTRLVSSMLCRQTPMIRKKNTNTQNAACFFQHHKDLETFYSPRVQLQTHSETVFGLGFFLGINAAAIEGI